MDQLTNTVYLATAYLAPVQYYTKLLAYNRVFVETAEHYPKQTYRNRCVIATTNGLQNLSIPIEKPLTEKCLTQDIRISDHGNWRHLHWQALVSAYGMSPFFEYCQDDFAPFYEKRFAFLIDLNEQLRHLVCELIDLQPNVAYTTRYEPTVANDFREAIHPKHPAADASFAPYPYYQVFQHKHSFWPNTSIVDLLFNLGPEALLVLQRSVCSVP